VEAAHWFYIDEYVSDESKASSYTPKLRHCSLKDFAEHMFRHIPFLRGYSDDVDTVLEDWREYKLSVPTYGAIILNEDLTRVILVQSYWNRTSWGFPKGKVNEEEEPHLCAIREVLEETGYNIGEKIDPDQYSEQVLNGRLSRLYFIAGVPSDTKFCPRTKNEIRDVQWFEIDLLPTSKKDPIPDNLSLSHNSLYMVMPFVRAIRKWVASKKRGGNRRRSTQPTPNSNQHHSHQQSKNNKKDSQQHQHNQHQQQHPPFDSPSYMPKSWMNFHFKKKDLYQAIDQSFRH